MTPSRTATIAAKRISDYLGLGLYDCGLVAREIDAAYAPLVTAMGNLCAIHIDIDFPGRTLLLAATPTPEK